jgi:hypothetical protein
VPGPSNRQVGPNASTLHEIHRGAKSCDLGRDIRNILVSIGVEDAQYVRSFESGESLGFICGHTKSGSGLESLQRNVTLEMEIPGAIHNAEATPPEDACDVVPLRECRQSL